MVAYLVERSTLVHAPAEQVRGNVADFHRWVAWSPWEDVDPDLDRVHSGPDAGVGARYAWSGNRRAGRGSMQITTDTAEVVELRLEILKPVAQTSHVAFVLTPVDTGTEVTWRMTGEQTGLMGVLGRVVPMDKVIGKDMQRGLTRLKGVCEETG